MTAALQEEEIKTAQEKLAELIRSDFARIDRMKADEEVTDAAAEMQGGLGSASSSNIGNKYALFEAIHGTVPYLISHGRAQYANPCSIVRAAGQLMARIGYGDRTAKLEKALDICCNTEKKLVVTTDKDGATSEEFTTYLLDTLKTL